MTIATVTRKTKAKVYRWRADMDLTRELVEVEPNACVQILDRGRDGGELGPDVLRAFEAWEDREDDSLRALRSWARKFEQAYADGDPFLPTRDGKGFVARADIYGKESTREAALYVLLENRIDGVTAKEARRLTGIDSDGISGTLSLLHKSKIVGVYAGDKR